MTGCNRRQADRESIFAEKVECSKGQMKVAWYSKGQDELAPNISGLSPDFIILIDTNIKATNFISFHEQYSRERSIKLDTSDLEFIHDWDKLTTNQKLEKVKQFRKSYVIQADSAHILNNQGQQQVLIINNSKDTVSVEMQDESFVCVLQALTKGGQWCPIQYRPFSSCGNSYFLKDSPPGTANSFITKLPNDGDYKTKLRYKLLGSDNAYYSNEFDGWINYCEFVKDSSIRSGIEM